VTGGNEAPDLSRAGGAEVFVDEDVGDGAGDR
jgi:hypothetical protein